MKKLGKFLFGTLTVATIAAGGYYLYKTYIKKDSSDDFEDFEEDFEDFDTDDEESTEQREYVPINLASESVTDEAEAEVTDSAPEEAEDFNEE